VRTEFLDQLPSQVRRRCRRRCRVRGEEAQGLRRCPWLPADGTSYPGSNPLVLNRDAASGPVRNLMSVLAAPTEWGRGASWLAVSARVGLRGEVSSETLRQVIERPGAIPRPVLRRVIERRHKPTERPTGSRPISAIDRPRLSRISGLVIERAPSLHNRSLAGVNDFSPSVTRLTVPGQTLKYSHQRGGPRHHQCEK